jgi:hypothetical protein
MDYATTQAQSEGLIFTPPPSPPRHLQDLDKAMFFSPQPTADGVDRLYRKLAEINAISAVQLAECACWRHSAPSPNPIWARTGR